MTKFIKIILLAFTPVFFPAALCQESNESRGIVREKERLDSLLEKIGLRFEASYKGEFWANTRGGIKLGYTHLHDIDISASLDTEGAGLWSDGEYFVQILSNQGGSLLSAEMIGDIQTVSNIEAPPSTRIHQLWYEHTLFSDRLSLLFGIHDFNSDFVVTENSTVFINSAFGISSYAALAARVSIFPLTTPGFRVRFTPNPAWKFLFGLYNGNPGLYDRFPSPDFNNRAGALIAAEGAFHYSRDSLPGTLKFGFWKNTGIFEEILEVDPSGNPIEHQGNDGWYLIADKKLTQESDAKQGLGVFLQLDWAPDKNVNPFTSYIGAGFQYTGLVPHRDMDEIGIALARFAVNDTYRNMTGSDRAETALEVTYRAVLHPMVAIQPDLQFIFNPGANPGLGNAVVAGIRLELTY